MCQKSRSYEHKKNRNRAVARFRFFVVNAKKEHDMFCPSLFFSHRFFDKFFHS